MAEAEGEENISEENVSEEKQTIPIIREDKKNPFLRDWEKESRIWYNSDPAIDEEVVSDHELSDSELKEKYYERFKDIKCVFVDLDGTIMDIGYNDVIPIPRAVEAFKKLTNAGMRVIFLVNTWIDSKFTTTQLVKRAGFKVIEEDFFTSSDCCKVVMKKNGLSHPFLLVSDEVLDDFKEMKTTDPTEFDSLIVGLPCTMIDYRLLTKATNILLDGNPMFILNPAKITKVGNATQIVASGMFANTLKFATDAKEIVPAKPTHGFFVEACKYAGFCATEVLMIGDDISDDIKGAKSTHIKSILVKTGVYKYKDEEKYCNFTPDALADDFANAVRILLCAQSKNPLIEEGDKEEKLRLTKFEKEKQDYKDLLEAYSLGDCNRKRHLCAFRMPSIIW